MYAIKWVCIGTFFVLFNRTDLILGGYRKAVPGMLCWPTEHLIIKLNLLPEKTDPICIVNDNHSAGTIAVSLRVVGCGGSC